ncbi:hypothetical protein DMH26_01985 [Streptomyces sp. WAC 05379]|nr:hypothetical protein DMH26_01985 [Streptomyces sp. WAC 05379]
MIRPTGVPLHSRKKHQIHRFVDRFWASVLCRVPGAGCRVPGAGCRVPWGGGGWITWMTSSGADGLSTASCRA